MSSTIHTQSLPQSPHSSSQQSQANSLVCKATFVYSKQENPRDIEHRVRALHCQLSQQARGESAKRGLFPYSVVTIVKPIHADYESSPSVAGSSVSTLSSLGSTTNQRTLSGLHRTQSTTELQSITSETTLRSRPTQPQNDLMEQEGGWGYFEDDEEDSSEPSQTIYRRFISYFVGSI